MCACLSIKTGAQAFARMFHACRTINTLQFLDGGNCCCHGCTGIPKRTSHVSLSCRFTETVGSGDCCKRITIGDCLGISSKVRLNAGSAPASTQINAEAATHIIKNERRTRRIAKGACRLGEFCGGKFLRDGKIVLEGGDNDCSQIVTGLFCGGSEAFNIVVNIVDEVSTIFGCYADE